MPQYYFRGQQASYCLHFNQEQTAQVRTGFTRYGSMIH